MNLKEVIRFTYGLIFGTSTPYLKPKKRYLFPVSLQELGKDFLVLLGGSCVCCAIRENGETLIINTNSREVSSEWHSVLQARGWLDRYSVIVTSMDSGFSGGLSHFIGEPAAGNPNLIQCWTSENVTVEKRVEFAGESLVLVPLGACATEGDLVIYAEKKAALFLGAVYYNGIHPPLKVESAQRANIWMAQLETLLSRFPAKIVVPGEGDIGTLENAHRFLAYMRALSSPAVEFSECRRDYDWIEIPSATSLEENFDLLRGNAKSHTTL